MVFEIGIVFASHRRDVVRTHRSVVVDVFVCAHCSEHVSQAVIVPGLNELGGIALHVTEVDDVDPVAEMTDRLRDVNAHRCVVTLTERDTIVLAIDDIESDRRLRRFRPNVALPEPSQAAGLQDRDRVSR